uniref:MFS domain-containing protein n=1 Tax=Globodera pallida TaxID=36090 RepID=A0A183C3K9_GLOPA
MTTTLKSSDGKIFPVQQIASASQASASTSIRSSSSSADSFADRKTDWRSIYLCTLVCFCGQVQFSLFLNSQFAFMKTLDPTVSEGFFGIIVGSYSLMQMLFSPLLGIWAKRTGQMRVPLLVCNAAMLVGNVLYFVIEWFPVGWMKHVMLLSRLVAGIGPAQISLLVAYATVASVDNDRSRAMAWTTGGIAMGITIGPTFQWLFTFIGYPGWRPNQWVSINMFTATALFAISTNVLIHFLLQFFFRESTVGILDTTINDNDNNKKKSAALECAIQKLPPYDRWALALCCAMRFTQYLIFTNLETIGTSYAMMMFGWSSTDVVTYESFAHTARGLLTLLVYCMYIFFNLGHKINERLTCLFSLFGLMAFHFVTYPWPFLPNYVMTFDSTNKSMAQLGCEANVLSWCEGLTQVNVWVYYVFIFLCIGIAFPNINATMIPLLSRVIGPRIQTQEQGLLEMCGGLGRMVGPALIGQLYRSYGPRPIWILECVEIGVMVALWLAFYRRLIPLKIPNELIGTKTHKIQLKHDNQMKRTSCTGTLPS